jgi:tubulin monoglycylase TTLL3/8
MENPMLIDGRKFDLRLWVLVTDWNPLTVWIWNESYAKFATIKYNAKKIDNLFSHLTNNAIAKKFVEKYQGKIDMNETMWYDHELAAYLKNRFKTDIWNDKIFPKMKQIVKYSLLCA